MIQTPKIEERQKNPIKEFTTTEGTVVNQETVLAKMDEKLQKLETELERLKGQDKELGSDELTADERAQIEFQSRVFKNYSSQKQTVNAAQSHRIGALNKRNNMIISSNYEAQ